MSIRTWWRNFKATQAHTPEIEQKLQEHDEHLQHIDYLMAMYNQRLDMMTRGDGHKNSDSLERKLRVR